MASTRGLDDEDAVRRRIDEVFPRRDRLELVDKKAEARWHARRAESAALRSQLDLTGPVDPAEIERAEADRVAAESTLAEASVEPRRLVKSGVLARRWADLSGSILGIVAERDRARRVMAEASALDRGLEAHRGRRRLAEETANQVARRIDEFKSRLGDLAVELATDERSIDLWRDQRDRLRATIPGPWRPAIDAADPAQYDAWEAERSVLRGRGIEDLAAELPRAHFKATACESELRRVESEIADIPVEARRPPEAFAADRTRADARNREADEARVASVGRVDTLRRDREARASLEARARDADRSRVVAEALAGHLGPRGLRRDLLRDAERGILDHANPILREVSGGDLELRLVEHADEADDTHALALEALVRTHGTAHAINVAYLSGSQRFRVAVSLALGIGRYARGLNRPIESGILNEGSGSLDREGRDERAAELNAPRGRLARIVLVTHQDAFADAFRDGYRFTIRDGSTVVEPFHR